MNSNSKKSGGFTLIEAVICMAILSIISIGIYDGLMIVMKQIKQGQIKQAAALEGKKMIETMQNVSFGIPDSSNNYEINLGNDTIFKEQGDNKGQIEKDASGNMLYIRNSGNYIEKITLAPTTATPMPLDNETTGENVNINTNGTLNSKSNKLYISKINSQDYIRYWHNPQSQYTPISDSSTVLIPSDSQSQIEMYVYFTTDSSSENQIIDIKDYTGKDLFSTPITKTNNNDKDLVVSFSNYINSDGSIPTNDKIEFDVYNKTSDVPNIYIEKSQELNVDIETCKGQVNIYDNRSENPVEDDVGTLYDITLQINDANDNNLFTGYYKKNIGQ